MLRVYNLVSPTVSTVNTCITLNTYSMQILRHEDSESCTKKDTYNRTKKKCLEGAPTFPPYSTVCTKTQKHSGQQTLLFGRVTAQQHTPSSYIYVNRYITPKRFVRRYQIDDVRHCRFPYIHNSGSYTTVIYYIYLYIDVFLRF